MAQKVQLSDQLVFKYSERYESTKQRKYDSDTSSKTSDERKNVNKISLASLSDVKLLLGIYKSHRHEVREILNRVRLTAIARYIPWLPVNFW